MCTAHIVPAHPPRPCTPGEGIFLNEWIKLLGENASLQADIMQPMAHMAISDEVFGRVSGSLMVYLGCSGGRSLISECEAAGYLQAWAIHNQRCRGLDNGLRVAEYILAKEHPISHPDTPGGQGPGRVIWDNVPVVTQDEYDVFEAMICWLSTHDAREFVTRTRALATTATQERLRALTPSLHIEMVTA